MPRLLNSRREFVKETILLSALSATVSLVSLSPAAVAQGGYDTTDIAPPEEVRDHGPKPEPQEFERQGGEDYVPGTSKYYQPQAIGDVEGWFAQYDDIRRRFESTPQERQYLEQLISKPPGSGLSDGDRQFLQDMANRYGEAFNQMKEVPACSETQHLHRGYGIFAAQQAQICMDYIRILGEPNAVDKMGRPLNAGMTDKRRYLYQLEKNNRLMDMRTRQTFNVSKNPYERRE
ncbi:MAG TPA: hypothetical protein EYN91_21680 [Candidatus Melainabacteria bacterium]|nr:hypothetical protein [Candidatus Melainabacteria bacterium]HIN66793.1 hypothetical protein [Candidatus Obscuribacterales bacterium]